jgi:hypothetical protein
VYPKYIAQGGLKKENQMSTKLSVQSVSSVIRSVPGISISKKYSSGKSQRSTGVYTEQERFSNNILIGYWSAHNLAGNSTELDKVIDALTNKGFKVISHEVPAFYGSSVIETKYTVELA